MASAGKSVRGHGGAPTISTLANVRPSRNNAPDSLSVFGGAPTLVPVHETRNPSTSGGSHPKAFRGGKTMASPARDSGSNTA